ncbi:hypothetical protein NFI96_006057, partial [Prochilodus magdalenae]
MTKAATKTAIIECTFPSDCAYYIHWYQKKEKETLRRVQYVYISNGNTQNEPGFEFLKSEKKAVGVLGQTVEQPEFFWTKALNKRAYISCKVTGLQDSNYVHWYQQKDGEAPKRILYVNKDGSSTVHNPDHPEAKDFTLQLENVNHYVLRVKALKLIHSGVYYCACWDWSSHIAVLGVTVEQSELLWTKLVRKRVSISCKVTGLSTSDYVHWYQQKDGEALKRILYINQDGSGLIPDSDHPQARDFSVRVDKRTNSYDLRVDTLKTSHTAVYYCACWERGTVTVIIHILYKNSDCMKHYAEIRSGRIGVLGLTLEQRDFSWTKQRGKRANIKCTVTGLQSGDYVHWYQQKDGEAPKRILYVNKDVAVLGVTVEQTELLWTTPAGKRVYISCKVTGLTTDYVHWYQQKDGEAPKRILYIKQDGSGLTPDFNHKEAKDFTVKVNQNSNTYYLKVDTLKTIAVLGVTVEQSELSWTKLVGKRVFISCKVTGLSTTYIHWYQQKDGEAPKRILYINQDGSGLTYDSNLPQARDFNVRVDKKSNSYDL